MKLELSVLPGRFAVCQQDAKAPMPRPEALGELWALVRTADELSLVVREELADPHWKVEAGWRCIGSGQHSGTKTGDQHSLDLSIAG